MSNGNTGEIDPAGGDDFYSSLRDSPSLGPSETGALLPAEEPLPGDTVSEGGGGGIGSFLFYFADGTTLTLGPVDDIYGNLAENVNWSLKFAVSSGAITNAVPIFDSVVDRFDGDAATTTAQTFYRVNLIYNEVAVCTGGVFVKTFSAQARRDLLLSSSK